ncbi:hypothetical protein [Pseudolysinimonas sp.]|uniref:hypothetical protein n=1 Tax=Pseudolysinimonas sp. TaxID=2680009 RepID=UPI003F80BBE0
MSDPAGTQGGDLSDDDQLRKDRSYSPSSGRETDAMQNDPEESNAARDAGDRVQALPGTGGPDDVGDVDVPDDEVNMPRDEGTH